ncbi:hypothetical protein ACW2Q0_18390 [Nocardia sp. R16R-3T]
MTSGLVLVTYGPKRGGTAQFDWRSTHMMVEVKSARDIGPLDHLHPSKVFGGDTAARRADRIDDHGGAVANQIAA